MPTSSAISRYAGGNASNARSSASWACESARASSGERVGAGRLASGQVTGKLRADLLGAGPADHEAMADGEQPRREPRVGRQLFGVGGEAHERFLQ